MLCSSFFWWWLKGGMLPVPFFFFFFLPSWWRFPPPSLLVYERTVWPRGGKVITLLFIRSSITGTVKPNRRADRAMTGPLIWQLLRVTKQRAPITSKQRCERHLREADAGALLCHCAGVFIVPLTCCTPGSFRGSIQVAKMGKRAERLPRGWAARTAHLPGGRACAAARGRHRLLKQICVWLFCGFEGCIRVETEMDFILSWLYSLRLTLDG